RTKDESTNNRSRLKVDSLSLPRTKAPRTLIHPYTLISKVVGFLLFKTQPNFRGSFKKIVLILHALSTANCHIFDPDMWSAIAYMQVRLSALTATTEPSEQDKIVANCVNIH
ncbi:MAG: hypothetical protein SCABRO_00678, partial [Candidatus Scalindua brodae]